MIAERLRDEYRVVLKTDTDHPMVILHMDDFSDLFGIGLEQILKKEGTVEIEVYPKS